MKWFAIAIILLEATNDKIKNEFSVRKIIQRLYLVCYSKTQFFSFQAFDAWRIGRKSLMTKSVVLCIIWSWCLHELHVKIAAIYLWLFWAKFYLTNIPKEKIHRGWIHCYLIPAFPCVNFFRRFTVAYLSLWRVKTCVSFNSTILPAKCLWRRNRSGLNP